MESARRQIKQNISRHGRFYTVFALFTVLSLPIIVDLVKDWMNDGNYSHGFLVIPISVYFFHRSSKGFRFPAESSKLGLAVFLFGCLGQIAGVAASEYFTSRVSLLIMVFGFS